MAKSPRSSRSSRMKPAMRAHYINSHNLNMKRLEQQAHKLILRTYRRQHPRIIAYIHSGYDPAQLVTHLPKFYKDSIKPLWKSTLRVIWSNAAEEADSFINDWIDPNAVKKDWTDAATEWMDSWGAGRIDSITNSDRSRMNTILSDGAARGQTPQEIASNLTDNFDDMTTGRAMNIARTETNGAYNYSSLQTATDVAGNWTKEWCTTSENPRPAHEDADGQEVPIDEPFDVDGEELMYPGDPSGSEGNVINCQCTMTYNSPSGGTEGAGAAPEGEE